MNNKRDIEFLYEIGCLRFIDRSWKQMFAPNFANLAEHHLRVIWLSIVLAKMEKKKVDMQKIMTMALVHDVGESRTGDAHYISRMYTTRDEEKAIKDIFNKTSLEGEMLGIWKEYESKKSFEAKIVKDADFLDVDFELQEQIAKGENHLVPWKEKRKLIVPKYYTKSAKILWQQIRKSNPSDWYLNARNRFNDGDFKPKKGKR